MPEHQLVQQAYDALGPWARADETGELLDYVRVLLSPLLDIDDVARGSDTHDGWGNLLDVDTAPAWVLPWLSQFVGVETAAGLSEEAQRIRIKEAAGFHRGTPTAIIAAAKQYLTGSRRVELYEREGGAWGFRLRTYLSETPDPSAVQSAVESLKPAGLVFTYEIQSGVEINGLVGTIDGLVGTIDSFSNVIPA